MREFIRGWRRKVGCAALVMAIAATPAWIRSYSHLDGLEFWDGEFRDSVYSTFGSVHWSTERGLITKVVMSIPYWAIVLTLTLLSAYLILWQPRKRTGPDHA